MNNSDGEPGSLPCSAEEARIGMPTIFQLHLVDAKLEKSPHPREDFYRQYSVTPERQTPEEERTPPPPIYTPGAILKNRKDWAASVAKGLKQFHAGRVMLRKETEQHGFLEEDPDYWSAKASHWQDEMWKLMKELGKRKKRELKGEAEEGYAQAMLLSPLQSPSPPTFNANLPEIAQHLKTTTATSDCLPKISTRPSQRHAGLSHGLLRTTLENSPDNLPTPTKDRKRTRTEVEGDEENSVNQPCPTKRQRREIATTQQKQQPVSATKGARGQGKTPPGFSVSRTMEAPNRKYLPISLAQCALPWKLRSRNVTSYRETGTRTTNNNRARQGKKSAHPRKSRLPEK